jgi:flagellar capping protein FliD
VKSPLCPSCEPLQIFLSCHKNLSYVTLCRIQVTTKDVEFRFQARKLEAWKKTWVDKVDTLRDLSHRVNSLQTANNALRVASSFITRMASSTNSTVADIAVDSTALLGSYKNDINIKKSLIDN